MSALEEFGFIIFRDGKNPFLYTKNQLRIFPRDEEEWAKWKQEAWERMTHPAIKEGSSEWIKSIQLFGENQKGQEILFEVSELFSINNGFILFEVNLYCVYSPNIHLDSIEGFYLSSADIDNYLCPNRVFHFGSSNDYQNKKEVSYGSEDIDLVTEEWGICEFKEVRAEVSLEPFVTTYFGSNTPMDVQSRLIVKFVEQADIVKAVSCIDDLRCYFHYVTCRKNIDQLRATLFWTDEKGRRRTEGKLVFINALTFPKETHRDCKDRIIKGHYLAGVESRLIAQISSGDVFIEHIWNSIDQSNTYGMDRQVLIFTAFYREFGKIFGKDYGRNPLYVAAKEKVCKLIDDEQNWAQGKERKYLKEIGKSVSRIDNGLSQRINVAMNGCIDIITPFILLKYDIPDGEATRDQDVTRGGATEFTNSREQAVKNVLQEIADRMNAIRNDIVHGNFEVNVDPIHLTDFKMMEILLYAMRLKNIGVETKSAQQAISDLFDARIIVNEHESV